MRGVSCGQIFTAQEPEGVGPEKYDETATAMIAQLKYGSGVPFNRLQRVEELMGVRAGAKCHQNTDLKSHLNAEAGCPS